MLPISTLTTTATAAAMLDPTRLAILRALREPGSAASVAAKLSAPRQRIGDHVRALEQVGLVEPVMERAHGGLVERLVQASAAGYVIAPQVLGRSHRTRRRRSPIDSPPAINSRWRRGSSTTSPSCARAERARKTVPTLTLDTRVRVASADAQQAFATDLANAVARVIEKHHDDRTPGGRTFACAVTVHPNVTSADTGGTP